MNILNIRNVLIIGDATVKKPKKIADEIQDFAKKFDDELYTKDIIRRAKGLMDIEDLTPYAMVINLNDESCSDMGCIGVRPMIGGLVRTS